MRDWIFDAEEGEESDAEEGEESAVEGVRKLLLEEEDLEVVPKRGVKAAAERNQIRALLKSSFASITICLFPVPVENLQATKVSAATLTEGFKAKLGEFRATVAEQLREPMCFNGKPTTCALLADLVPTIAKALNDPDQEMLVPQTLFAQVSCC